MNESTRLVILCHASPRRNVRGILARGLLSWLAKGKMKVTWLHSPAKTAWAVQHVAARHLVDPRQVIVFEVIVPRSRLRRRSRGIGPVRPSSRPSASSARTACGSSADVTPATRNALGDCPAAGGVRVSTPLLRRGRA